jgi:hypothetical protein
MAKYLEAPELPVTQLPPAGLRVRDWGSRRAAGWQRVVFFALIAPVAIPLTLVWRVLVAGWRESWPGPPEYSSELRGSYVHWYERGRLVGVYEHTGTPPGSLPKDPS